MKETQPTHKRQLSEERKQQISESLKKYHAERRGRSTKKKVGAVDTLAQDAVNATAAGMSYGKWKAMQPAKGR